MRKYTNKTGISVPMAAWLANDEYDGKSTSNPYLLSATGLLKSPRQIVLGIRSIGSDEEIDVSTLIKSKIGTAIHDSVERTWTNPDRLPKTLLSLGYPEHLVQRIQVNPDVVTEGSIPVYLEQRETKQIGKWFITGKFDMVFDGQLRDIKSTSTFTYTNSTKNDDYSKQGSIYRWLNPDKITSDVVDIDFVFTDFKQNLAVDPNYPPSQICNKSYPLMSPSETENWIRTKLNRIEAIELLPEDQLPECNDDELWRRESQWKYYKTGQVTARSTKNFDNAADAYKRKADDGGTGLVLEIKGQPTACLYCNVSALCTQKDRYIASGELTI